jgi:glucose/arabinose dehydrogenase
MTDTRIAGVMAPTYVHADSAGMAGATRLSGRGWRDWEDGVAVAFLSGAKLAVVRLDASFTRVVQVHDGLLAGRGQRLRQPVVGPDGALYVTVDGQGTGGAILRVQPS